MAEKIVKEEKLENGRTLVIVDQSRKIAGDRWLVALNAEITIPVDDVISGEEAPSSADPDKIKDLLGPEVVYTYKDERNFVDDHEKETVFNGMLESYMNSSLSYLSNPAFPRRFVLREYARAQEKRTWYPSEDA